MFKDEANNCLKRAEKSYEEAIRLMNECKYPEAVDKFHDSIENLLKTILNLYEIPYKPTHDVVFLLPKIKEKMDENDPNYYLYSEIVLPPFIAIHKILKEIRNMARYGYKGVSSNKIFNEVLAKSIHMMIDGNIGMLKGWIFDILTKKKDLRY